MLRSRCWRQARGRVARDLLTGSAAYDDVVRALLDGLEADPASPSVLIVDDVHCLKNRVTGDSLELFVQHVPAWLHVVLVGRTDPHLPLDRLRVRGQLAELRFAELRFTDDEARVMLEHLAPDLSTSELEDSVRYTDGWAAGLQLTALAARSAHVQVSPISLLPDAQLLTEDYVWHEVLASGDAEVVDALLQIAVVDRVNSGLAAAITNRSDVRDLLLRAETQGLFVHRLGADGWFRIHPLVRDALRTELGRQSRRGECHARAARWFEDSGETVSALDQWLLADRPRDALRLLAASSTELYDQGREAVILRTIEAIPRSVATTDVAALVDYAVSHILVSRPQFIDAVREVAWHAERSEHDFAAQIAGLQAVALTMAGDWNRGSTRAREALSDLGDRWWNDPAGRFAWNMAARGVALSEGWDDDDELVSDATIAMHRDPGRGLSLEGIRAMGHAFAGRPIDALRVAAGVRHAAPTMSILRSELDVAEAMARLEIGDRERAIADLRAIADDTSEPKIYCTAAAIIALASAAVDDGDVEAASCELSRVESMLAGQADGHDVREWVNRAATTIAIAAGDMDEARRRTRGISDAFWGPVCRARIDLAVDDRAAAAAVLSTAVARCVRHEVILELLRARVQASSDDALHHVTSAVELASSHGMLQTVVSEGRPLVDVIERAAWRVPDEWLYRLRLAIAPAKIPARPPTREFLEPLTERERDVLRLLPSRLTLSEIAKELYVSVNTLKFHLRVIYRKLGVNSREEAAAIARSMTTVPSTPSS